MTGRLRQFHISGNNGAIHEPLKVLMQLLGYLVGQSIPWVVQRSQNTLYLQRRIDRLSHGINRLQQRGKAFESKILALHGNEDRLRRNQRVQGQHIQRRRTIDNHKIVATGIRLQSTLETFFSIVGR